MSVSPAFDPSTVDPSTVDPSTVDPSTIELHSLVPHRPPMLLLDAVHAFDADHAVCRVDVREGAPFVVDGRLPAVVTLEYMAQCIAAFAGLASEGGTPRIGYLVGVRELDLAVDEVRAGERLLVEVRHLWSNEISGSFAGQVSRAGETIARARLSVFIPPAEGVAHE